VSIRPHIISVTLLVVVLAGCSSLPSHTKLVDADLSPTPPSPDTAQKMQASAQQLEKTALNRIGLLGPGIGKLLDTLV